MHRGFGERTSPEAVRAFPVRFAQEEGVFDRLVSFQRAAFVEQDGTRAWRSDEPEASPSGRSVAVTAVVGPVTDYFPSRCKVSRRQGRLQRRRVMGLARGHQTGNDQGGVRIDAEVDLPIGTSLVPMNWGMTGIRAPDLEAGRIDDEAAAGIRLSRPVQGLLAAAQSGWIGSWQGDTGQLQDRAHQADGLPEEQTINLLKGQPQRDNGIGVNDGPAGTADRKVAFRPFGGETIAQVDRQIAALSKGSTAAPPGHFPLEMAHQVNNGYYDSMEFKTQPAEVMMPPPEVRRRRVRASAGMLLAQEAAAQLKNDVYSELRWAHAQHERLPSVYAMCHQLKAASAGIALGRAKQVQHAIADAFAMFRSFRSNVFAWAKDPATRPGKPRPPRFYRRGQRARVCFDYQDLKVREHRLYLPASFGVDVLTLVKRDGEPLLGPGDRLVEVRVEPCRSRQWVHLDLIIRRAASAEQRLRAGSLLVDLGVARLATCLDDKNLTAFFVDGGVAKAILQRGAKWHARLRSEAALGVRHGKARARALARRSARQMEDLIKKVALQLVTYAKVQGLARVVAGRNKAWKQEVNLGKKQNQLFTFIPHQKLIEALRTKCVRAGIEFVETEESHTSKTDHLACEAMGPKPRGYRWLGSRRPRGCFRSSMGFILQADVNGCIGLGRKAGGEQWLNDFIGRLGSSPGTRLVPRKVHVNGRHVPVPSPGVRMPHCRGLSSKAWISTKVALVKAGLIPDLQGVASATYKSQGFPKAA